MKHLLLIILCLASIFCFAQTNDAIQLDGGSAYAQVPDNNALDLSATLTLEAWIYPTGPGDPTQGGMILNKENSYEIARFPDGTIQYAFSANGAGTDWVGWINTGLVAPQDQWTHVAMVKNGTAITIYMNAVASFTANNAPANLTANTYNLRIGHRSIGASPFFQGYLDEVRIWNTARTSAEIKENLFNRNLSNSATGMVAYYRMNEGSGSTLTNSCTNTSGIDGTLYGGYSWAASPVQYSGNALNFDGINDAVSIADSVNLDLSNAITLEAWVYATKNTGLQNVICKSSSSQNTGYIFPRTTDGWSTCEIILHIGNWVHLTATYPSLNAWHHLAATYDGASIKMYIDGNLVASSPQTGTITTNTNPLTLGNQPGTLEYFGGSADECKIWNVARTQAEIQNDMMEESNPSTQTNLVSYFNMNQGIATGTNTGLATLIDQAGNNNGTLSGISLTGATSNFTTQNSSLFSLPLKWLAFTAQKQNEAVLLDWTTASESNVADFKIEHSCNGNDWQVIGQLSAANGSNNHYSFADIAPEAGINYYRIRQTDLDGKSTYSEIRSVRMNTATDNFNIINNPVTSGTLQLQTNLSSGETIRLFSAEGRLIWTKKLNAGRHSIDVSALPKGLYLLKGINQTEKILLQ